MTGLSYRPASQRIASLLRDRRGMAAIETAVVAPVLLFLGMGGIELANYSVVRMRLSQLAMNMADNASRVGLDTGLSSFQMTEGDVNDTVAGAVASASSLDLLGQGRVIISSLEMNKNGGQWIHWQRCIGVLGRDAPDQALGQSAYGPESTGITGTAFTGMGPSGGRIATPSDKTAVMYVELNYKYKPLFAFLWSDTRTTGFFSVTSRNISYGNAFMVRDNRDLNTDTTRNAGKGIFNPNSPLTGQPAPQRTCNTYSPVP